MSVSIKKDSLLELLPINIDAVGKSNQTQSTIDHLTRFLKISKEAIELFLKEELHLDPLVGENACQIRAVRFSAIANKTSSKKKFELALGRINNGLEKLSKVQLGPKENTSVGKVLEKNDIQLIVSKGIREIVAAHILCLARTNSFSITKTNSQVSIDEIREETGALQKRDFGNTVSRNLEKKCKEFLSQRGVDYVRKQLKNCPTDSDSERLASLISDENVKKTKLNFVTAPGLASTEICLKSALRKGTPLALKVQCIDEKTAEKAGQFTLFFQPNVERTQFERVESSKIGNQAVIVFEAVSLDCALGDLREKILKKDIVNEIILPNFAAHPQYGGDLKDTKGPEDEKTNRLKELAIKDGLCKENQKFCRIYHVYVERSANKSEG